MPNTPHRLRNKIPIIVVQTEFAAMNMDSLEAIKPTNVPLQQQASMGGDQCLDLIRELYPVGRFKSHRRKKLPNALMESLAQGIGHLPVATEFFTQNSWKIRGD